MAACSSCGEQIWPEDRYCGWCGQQLKTPPQASQGPLMVGTPPVLSRCVCTYRAGVVARSCIFCATLMCTVTVPFISERTAAGRPRTADHIYHESTPVRGPAQAP